MDSLRSDPIVSVIVPAYNNADFIGEAIDSLLQQTLRDIEIIVVDDGSDDETFAIAQSRAAKDSRVRIVRREQSSGHPGCARNAGLKIATGEYIALLDADDIALPTRLAVTIAAMKSAHADIGFADMVRLDSRQGVRERTGMLAQRGFPMCATEHMVAQGSGVFSCRPEFLGFMLSHHSAVSVPTIVWTRTLLDQEQVWFDDALVCAEDLDLFFRLAARAKIVFVEEIVTVVRKHPNSLTAKRPIRTIADGVNIREKYLSIFKDRLRRMDIQHAKEFIADSLRDIAYGNWSQGRSAVARALYLRSFRARPTRAAAIGYLKAMVPRDYAVALLRPSTLSVSSHTEIL